MNMHIKKCCLIMKFYKNILIKNRENWSFWKKIQRTEKRFSIYAFIKFFQKIPKSRKQKGMIMINRVIYLVDYEKDGIDRHYIYDMLKTGGVTDNDIVNLLHFYVGKDSRLDSVIEFSTNMPIDEFRKIYNTAEVHKIPYRVLYFNMETAKNIRKDKGLHV